MVVLSQNLTLPRCPHCFVSNPNLFLIHHVDTDNHSQNNLLKWGFYRCGRCGGVVSAFARAFNAEVENYYPSGYKISDDIPERPRAFLSQAHESLHAPSGAVMLAASAVDAMLKIKGYTEGNLYSRIEAAITDNVITHDMGKWAHEVRLDANDQRHADEEASLPNEDDAKRVLEFASALAEIMFVLPSRVQRGLAVAAS